MKSISEFPQHPKHGDEMRFDYPEIKSYSIWRYNAFVKMWEFVDMFLVETANA